MFTWLWFQLAITKKFQYFWNTILITLTNPPKTLYLLHSSVFALIVFMKNSMSSPSLCWPVKKPWIILLHLVCTLLHYLRIHSKNIQFLSLHVCLMCEVRITIFLIYKLICSCYPYTTHFYTQNNPVPPAFIIVTFLLIISAGRNI